jgi:hypothetical protein
MSPRNSFHKLQMVKINFKFIFLFLLFLSSAIFFCASSLSAMDLTSTSFIIKDPIVGTGGGYGSSASFQLISAGNTLFSGVGDSASFSTRYGFLYYEDEVAQTITFDIDTASDFSNGESSTPYSVALGTLSTGSVTHSDTSSVKMIVLEADSSDGVVVTVNNANGSNGLVSASVGGDNINSTTGTMSAGTENYGLCVATSGLTGFIRSTGYVSDTCALASGTNQIRSLSTTPTSIVDSGGSALTGGHAEVVVNAAISSVTPAHADYADAITFIATSTY